MARVSVFLKDQLLDQINEEAKDEGTNRSSLIQSALEGYLQSKREKREEEKKRKKMLEASRKMDKLAENYQVLLETHEINFRKRRGGKKLDPNQDKEELLVSDVMSRTVQLDSRLSNQFRERLADGMTSPRRDTRPGR